MVLTYTPNEVGHQWLKWGSNKPTASQWHSSRRAAIIRRYPEVLNLLSMSPYMLLPSLLEVCNILTCSFVVHSTRAVDAYSDGWAGRQPSWHSICTTV
eukprot:m.108088 g.108088  ORF g.108088 m.108088 type:complete len:98 (+) comp15329_c0_seq2:109-402(+)